MRSVAFSSDIELISIHALAKRATIAFFFNGFGEGISIHALAKRATYAMDLFSFARHDFNPRPRKEGDSVH